MTLGIYKPGQGYWVRVMTATIIGVITMAMAAWLWDQSGVLIGKIPSSTYAMALQNMQGAPVAGQHVDLMLATPERGRQASEKIGTAVVESYNNLASQVKVTDVQMTPGPNSRFPSDATELRASDAGSTFSATVARGTQTVALVEPMLVQGGIVAIVIILGALMAYYFCATKPGTVEFLVATDMEMKKVNWSSRREILGSTWVVIAASILIAAALFGVDVVFQWFFKAIGVLATK